MANKDGQKLWHPSVVTSGSVDLKKLSEEIAELSSPSEGDVYNVCKNLVNVMTRHLQSSEVVQVDDFGTFRIAMRSVGKGFATSEEVNAQFCALRIKFLPSSTRNNDGTVATRAFTTGTTFKRIDTLNGMTGGSSSGGSSTGGSSTGGSSTGGSSTENPSGGGTPSGGSDEGDGEVNM